MKIGGIRLITSGVAACFVLGGLWHGASGQEIPGPVKKLYAFAGTWEGKGRGMLEGKAYEVTARYEIRQEVDGWGLQGTETIDIPQVGQDRSVFLFGYDPGSDEYHLYSIDNFGNAHDHRGKWKNDSVIELVYEGKRDGKKYIERLPLTIKGSEWHIVSKSFVDGKQVDSLELTVWKRERGPDDAFFDLTRTSATRERSIPTSSTA
jgi:hypothetical protein